MKITITKRIAGMALPGLMALLSSAHAATDTWNGTTSSNFNDPANWTPAAVPGSNDTAAFSNAAPANQPNVTANSTVKVLNFTTTGYDLTSANTSTSVTLTSTATTAGGSAVASQVASGGTAQIDAPLIFGATAASTQQIAQVSGGTLTLNGAISSTNSITLNYGGGGTIVINGSNSNTGSSVQTAGNNLIIGNSAAFGTSTLMLTSNGGKLTAGINLVGANAITNSVVWSANATLANSGVNGFEFSGTVDLGGAARIINSSTSAGATFDNVISNDGGGGLTIATANSSNVTLKGANTYSGLTTIAGTGLVTVSSINTAGNPGNLGTNAIVQLGSTTNAGTLAYTGAGETTDRTVDLGGTTGGATIDTTGATGGLVINGNVTASGVGAKTLTIQGNSNGNAINGTIVDSSGGATSVLKTGGGTWALSGPNTYSGGTTIRNGTLSASSIGTAGNPGNLGTNATINIGLVGNSGTLNYTGAGETTDRVINMSGATGGATIDTTNGTGALIFTSNFTATGTGSKTLTLKGGNGDTIQGTIVDNSVANTTALNKTGGGTWILSGANTYSGGTTVSNGTLRLTGANATLGIGSVFVTTNANNLNITTGVLNAIADNATLSLAGGGAAGVADDGYAKLGNGIDEVVGMLILGGSNVAPGTYGSSTSGAANVFDEYFSGNGIVTVVPEPSVYAMVILGSGLLIGARRLRRNR